MSSHHEPLWGLGGLVATMSQLIVIWSLREPPEPMNCGGPGPPGAREAWLAGLAPAAFAAACACAWIVVWASPRREVSPASVRMAGLVLALGAWWWIAGEDSYVWWWAVIVWVGLVPSVVVVPALLAWLGRAVWTHHAHQAWQLVRVLAWWTLLVAIPAFVGVISEWNADFYC